jgi:hypothetical protein
MLGTTLQETLGLDRDGVERLCRAAGIDGRRRGETLTLEEFAQKHRVSYAADSKSVRAGRVVVREDHCGGVAKEPDLHDFAEIHAGLR